MGKRVTGLCGRKQEFRIGRGASFRKRINCGLSLGSLPPPAAYRFCIRPARARFVDAMTYYSTLFHGTHPTQTTKAGSTRILGARFGDELYSNDELGAELRIAFLCAVACIANENSGTKEAP
jgi:Zincin-like metallopeptidase